MTEPAILSNGTKVWYLKGEHHRVDGPAIVRLDGYQAWYFMGKLHRKDGPAVTHPNGTNRWYLNGQIHRAGGPAVEYPDGSKEWWMCGKRITELTDNLKRNYPQIYDQLLVYQILRS